MAGATTKNKDGNGFLPNTPDIGITTKTQQLIALYVGQLLHGCQNQDCTESMCYTGRLNTSRVPVRRYTPRSARALALGLVGGPLPRAHLCKYFLSTYPNTTTLVESNSPRDPSSMIQQLCDTENVQQLQDPSSTINLDGEVYELRQMHDRLNGLVAVAGRLPPLSGKGAVSDILLADELRPNVSWLLAKLPAQRPAPWMLVNREFISRGQAYPQRFDNTPTDDSYNTWLSILDILSHEPYLRLLARVVQVIACRSALYQKLGAGAPSGQHRPSAALPLVKQLIALDDDSRTRTLALIVWLKKLFAKHWNGRPIITHGSVCHGVLEFMACVCEYEAVRTAPKLDCEAFRIPFVASTVGMVELCQSRLDWSRHGRHDLERHLLNWSWIFSSEQLVRYFRTSNHLIMRTAHSEVEQTLSLWRRNENLFSSHRTPQATQFRHAQQHYLLLNVSRDDILKDTFDQLWQRRKDELRRPLRVRLGETNELEIGHDLGGVQIEFFNLICREVFSEEARMALQLPYFILAETNGDVEMFTTDATTGYSYFKPGSLQPLYMFEMLGILLALALYNGITLPINMPLIFYKILLKHPSCRKLSTLSPSDVTDGWPTEARSLQHTLENDVPDIDFSFPIEANGVRLEALWKSHLPRLESDIGNLLDIIDAVSAARVDDGKPVDIESIEDSWPGWRVIYANTEAPSLTRENRTTYVGERIRHLVFTSVAPQWRAFDKGFRDSNIIDHSTLLPLAPEVLKRFVEGINHLDINELRAAARYDGFDSKSKYIHWFWKIVIGWPESKQKQLLKFVTAAERIPISGASNLTFIIKKSTPESLESLPTSSTCFGTLMLPRYPTAEVLAAKLNLALKYGTEGFGTG